MAKARFLIECPAIIIANEAQQRSATMPSSQPLSIVVLAYLVALSRSDLNASLGLQDSRYEASSGRPYARTDIADHGDKKWAAEFDLIQSIRAFIPGVVLALQSRPAAFCNTMGKADIRSSITCDTPRSGAPLLRRPNRQFSPCVWVHSFAFI